MKKIYVGHPDEGLRRIAGNSSRVRGDTTGSQAAQPSTLLASAQVRSAAKKRPQMSKQP